MDAVLLSRIQFAFTIGYHFIFVPISIGLAIMVVFAERRYHKSGIPADKAASSFWIKLFTTTFAIGVATGLTMEFAFGANWAGYSRFVGDIFGAPLAAEGLFAFFLESTFLGVLLFGRKKVSRGLYYAASWLVLIGTVLSALWILIANSWQQTPAGYRIEGGRAVLTDFWAAALNPSTAPRFVHTVTGAVITGCFVVASICAWYLLKKRHLHFARQSLVTALVVGLVASAAMPLIGHWHALEVAAHQPVKMAAFESLYDTRDHAPMYLFGWVRENNGHPEVTGLAIPSGLSLLLGLSPSRQVTGLDSVPPEDRPPLQITFQSYHLMIALSFVFIAVMLLALAMHVLKRLEQTRWLLWLLVVCFPLPIIAMNMGWTATEVGRQPWIVQGLLRTSDGVSPVVSAGEVWATLGLFALVYLVLFIGWLRIFLGIVRKGPDDVAEMLQADQAGALPAPSGAGR
ncbi:MAG: cytochrome ubiquinol oxidase subunit I [Thermoleophilia bacterium]